MLGTCLGVILILYGLIFVVINLVRMTQTPSRKFQMWSEVAARITSVQVHEIESTSSFVPNSTFRVELTYEYVVNEVRYTSQQILDGSRFHGQTEQQITDSVETFYPVGEEIWIIYDPQNPQVTLLGKPDTRPDKGNLGYGLIAIALGVGIMLVWPLLANL
jgi:hypothetical protein